MLKLAQQIRRTPQRDPHLVHQLGRRHAIPSFGEQHQRMLFSLERLEGTFQHRDDNPLNSEPSIQQGSETDVIVGARLGRV